MARETMEESMGTSVKYGKRSRWISSKRVATIDFNLTTNSLLINLRKRRKR
jgi:hypothetical protein